MRLRGLGDRDCWFSVPNRGLQQGYQARASTAACLLGALGPFACDLVPCRLPSVSYAAACVCGASVTEAVSADGTAAYGRSFLERPASPRQHCVGNGTELRRRNSVASDVHVRAVALHFSVWDRQRYH